MDSHVLMWVVINIYPLMREGRGRGREIEKIGKFYVLNVCLLHFCFRV